MCFSSDVIQLSWASPSVTWNVLSALRNSFWRAGWSSCGIGASDDSTMSWLPIVGASTDRGVIGRWSGVASTSELVELGCTSRLLAMSVLIHVARSDSVMDLNRLITHCSLGSDDARLIRTVNERGVEEESGAVGMEVNHPGRRPVSRSMGKAYLTARVLRPSSWQARRRNTGVKAISVLVKVIRNFIRSVRSVIEPMPTPVSLCRLPVKHSGKRRRMPSSGRA